MPRPMHGSVRHIVGWKWSVWGHEPMLLIDSVKKNPDRFQKAKLRLKQRLMANNILPQQTNCQALSISYNEPIPSRSHYLAQLQCNGTTPTLPNPDPTANTFLGGLHAYISFCNFASWDLSVFSHYWIITWVCQIKKNIYVQYRFELQYDPSLWIHRTKRHHTAMHSKTYDRGCHVSKKPFIPTSLPRDAKRYIQHSQAKGG